MSRAGAQMDRVKVLAEGAIAGLTCERGVRKRATWTNGPFPLLFLYDPAESVEIETDLQETVTTTFSALLVTNVAQEATLLLVDAFRDAVRADRELNGAAAWAYVESFELTENPEDPLVSAAMVVLAVVEAA